nr:uncharacterized protein LOC131773467 [Pocillopora verrucosa]
MFPEHITVFIFVGLSFAQVSRISTAVTPTATYIVSSSSRYAPAIQPTTSAQDCPADGKPTVKSSCGRYTLQSYNLKWNDDLNNSSSLIYQILKKGMLHIVSGYYFVG